MKADFCFQVHVNVFALPVDLMFSKGLKQCTVANCFNIVIMGHLVLLTQVFEMRV